MSDPALVPVPYERFVADVRALAAALAAGDWRPDHIVGIGRGGLVPGVYLSHCTGVSMLSVDHSSGVPGFAGELVAKLAAATREGTRVLLIDDINDSGGTIAGLRAAFLAQEGASEHLRVAALIDNVRSAARVDYRARTIDRAIDKSWFVFPWEAMASRDQTVTDALSIPERLA